MRSPRIGRGRRLAPKNSLIEADAKLVEDAFERRLSDLCIISDTAVAPRVATLQELLLLTRQNGAQAEAMNTGQGTG